MIDFDDLDGAEDAGGEEVEAAREAAAQAWDEQKKNAEVEKEQKRKAAEEAHRRQVQELDKRRAQQLKERTKVSFKPSLTEEGSWVPLSNPLPQSPWFGCSHHNPQASVRVFCLHGVGVSGGSFVDWVSKETHAQWPAVEFVSLELPGHGNHYGSEAIVRLDDIAETLVEKLAEWTHGGRDTFAIYGFSLGARLAYEVSLRLGEVARGCCKIFVSCRGAPHHVAKPVGQAGEVKAQQSADQAGISTSGPSEREQLLMVLSALVDGDTLGRYASTFARWERMADKGDPEFVGRISTFRRALQADIAFCDAPVKFAEDGGVVKIPCPVKFYHSLGDEMWPPQLRWPPAERSSDVSVDEWGWNTEGAPCYKDLATSWSLYADDFASELVPGAHGDLGGPGSSIRERICDDLTKMSGACSSGKK